MRLATVFLMAGATLLTSAVPGLADTITVTIDRLVFSPAEITVKAGDTVEWVNKDAIAHTATVKDGWEVMIPPMTTASRVIQAEDTVAYFCRFHPNMKGSITVAQ